MSRTEININQEEMERCMSKLSAIREAWNVVSQSREYKMQGCKGRTTEMVERCVRATQQIHGTMDLLLEKTQSSFGVAKDKYEEIDQIAAKSMNAK